MRTGNLMTMLGKEMAAESRKSPQFRRAFLNQKNEGDLEPKVDRNKLQMNTIPSSKTGKVRKRLNK